MHIKAQIPAPDLTQGAMTAWKQQSLPGKQSSAMTGIVVQSLCQRQEEELQLQPGDKTVQHVCSLSRHSPVMHRVIAGCRDQLALTHAFRTTACLPRN